MSMPVINIRRRPIANVLPIEPRKNLQSLLCFQILILKRAKKQSQRKLVWQWSGQSMLTGSSGINSDHESLFNILRIKIRKQNVKSLLGSIGKVLARGLPRRYIAGIDIRLQNAYFSSQYVGLTTESFTK